MEEERKDAGVLSSEEAAVSEPNHNQTTSDSEHGPQIDSRYLIAAIVLVVSVAAAVGFSLFDSRHVAVMQFTNVYSFVPEKLSESAAIPISLPEGVTEEVARSSISFSPEIRGAWNEDLEEDGVIAFVPNKPLSQGVYYAVNMDTGSVQMSGDFFVDEDPRIEAIFPAENSESHEDTEITILFNRPMVPLTTLAEQEAFTDVPITITPETPGTFKWTSTRNLQFIPDTTLVPSSDYTVTIGDGFTSLDGLPVPPRTHEFITRPLRYEYITESRINYRSPMVVVFNQAVDLDGTEDMIRVTNGNGERIQLDVTYGETTYYSQADRAFVTEEDLSKLFIYQKRDTHGRARLWDFETNYDFEISGAVPYAGTVDLTQSRFQPVHVPNVVEAVQAQSDNTHLARPDFLDPDGTLTIKFFEDIDKDRSRITGPHIKDIEYGETCKRDEEGREIRLGSGCEKVPDYTTLIFSFDPIDRGTNFSIILNRLYNQDGDQVNVDEIPVAVSVYPEFEILKTVPENNASGVALDGMTVCTNSPLKKPEENGLSEYVSTDGYIVYGRWSPSRYIKSKSHPREPCDSNSFETKLNFGLLPETQYSLGVTLTDAFDQTSGTILGLTTQGAEEQYARFHNMQLQYNVTPPNRTQFTYATENLEYVDMHVCRMQPETFLERTNNRAKHTTAPRNDGCNEVVTDRIELPKRYWVHNYFQVNLRDYFADPRGHYVITFSNPLLVASTYSGGERTTTQKYDRTYVSVTNLAVGKKEVREDDDPYSYSGNPAALDVLESTLDQSSNLFWVSNMQTLNPIPGATVTEFVENEDDTLRAVPTGLTDSQGIARLAVEPNVIGAVVRSGLDSAVVGDWADTFGYSGYARDASRTYIYSDRPIYRPGHTVHIRGIDRIGFDGAYEIWNGDSIPLEIFDSQGNRVFDTELAMSEYGTFSTSFDLPNDAPLGNYRVEAFGDSYRFSVEEYVPAAFKLEAESGEEEYMNGDTVEVTVQADYYFGVPLDGGTVTYSATAQDYYFDRYEDEYFNFGRSWYYCYSCGYGDDFLFRGTADIDANGQAVISRDLRFEDYFDDLDEEQSKLVTFTITAKDVNGRSVSMQKSFVVHKGNFYIGGKTSKYYTGTGDPVTLRVKTVDTEGTPINLRGVEKTVYKVEWDSFKRQEVDGGFYYRSEKRLEEISRERINTDSNGSWEGTVTFDNSGQYEIHYVKNDDRGNRIITKNNLYIYGSQAVTIPQNNNYDLDLEVQGTDHQIGDTASILIKSPFPRAKALVTAERGTVYDYWIVDVIGGLHLHEFTIKDSYEPNIFMSALLISDDPEVKYGSTRLTVGGDQNKLSVDVTSNKDHYLPGEEVVLSLETKNNNGVPVSAEVSVAVADLSVLALKGNPKKSPHTFFYNGFPLAVTTASNIKNIHHEVDIPLGSKGGGGAVDLESQKRGDFRDTAYWEAGVVTNGSGQAEVRFTLPDNLTTWQIESLAVTKDTKLGVDYEEFTTKKDLMAIPLKPRFVIPGDRFSLGAQVFNQTDSDAEITVSLESSSLEFTGETTDSVFIGADESRTVYFDVVAPEATQAGEHIFTFTASGNDKIDAVEQSIPVTPNDTFETVATAHFTKDDQAVEYLYVPDEIITDKGGLTINANATMAVFMSDALDYMVTYPYGCSEQLSSSLSTIATLTSALNVPNVEGEMTEIEHLGVTYTVDEVVEDGLGRIYETQHQDGGFSYYKGLKSSLYLTMHVVDALHKLSEAGYEIRPGVLERGMAFIESKTLEYYGIHNQHHRSETVILAEYTLRSVAPDTATRITPLVSDIIADDVFINEKSSTMALAYLTILTTDGYSTRERNDVYEALQNRIEIDGRGAYLKTFENRVSRYYETPIKNTALLLKAFASRDDEHPTLGNTLRWLLASRDNKGAWGSTHNTFVVVDAMVDYLTWQKETESHFTLRGMLDGVEIFGHEFKPENIFDTFTHFVPTADLATQRLIPLVFEREDHAGTDSNFYYDMAFRYFLPAAALPPRDEGITITRDLFALEDTENQNPITEALVGEVVRGKVTITIPDDYTHVTVEDMIPAGFEIVNFNLATEDRSLLAERTIDSGSLWDRLSSNFAFAQRAQVFGGEYYNGGSFRDRSQSLYPTHIESHDDRIFLYMETLRPGVYEYEYFLRALVPGEFQHLPARSEELYFPEVFGRTGGGVFTINEE